MSPEFHPKNFASIKNLLDAGEVCVLPSDTIYGLAGDPTQESAIQEIQQIKKRPADKPFLLLVGNTEKLSQITQLSPFVQQLIQQLAPAPITFVLPRQPNTLPHFFPKQQNIAVRIPNNQLLLNFLNQHWHKALISTSANISGQKQANLSDFGVPIFTSRIKENELSSTIIQIDGERITVLRDERLLENKIMTLANEILSSK